MLRHSNFFPLHSCTLILSQNLFHSTQIHSPKTITRLVIFYFFQKKLALYFSIWYSISCSRRVGQVVKTPPSHGGFKGSNPLRVTTHIIARSKASGFFVAFEGRFLFSINFTQNLHILFSKHIYGEYPLHLYTDF